MTLYPATFFFLKAVCNAKEGRIEGMKEIVAVLFLGKIRLEKANLQSVLSQLKCLGGLSLDYQVSIDITPKHCHMTCFSLFGRASEDTQVDWIGHDSTPNGLLTDLGCH